MKLDPRRSMRLLIYFLFFSSGGHKEGGGHQGVPGAAGHLAGGGAGGEADGEVLPPLGRHRRHQGQLPDRIAHLLHQTHPERYHFLLLRNHFLSAGTPDRRRASRLYSEVYGRIHCLINPTTKTSLSVPV